MVTKKSKIEIFPLGVAIAGAGPEARRIARGYTDAGLNILAVWDRDGKAASDLAAELNAKPHDSLKSMLSDPCVNAVEIITPLEYRADDIAEAIEADKAISVRAPVCSTLESARKLAQAVARKSIKLRYLDPAHHHAPHALARKLAQGGEIGYLNGIRIKAACADVPSFDKNGLSEPLDRLAIAQWIMGPAEYVETMRTDSASITIIKFKKPHMFGNFEAARTPNLVVPFSERPWDETIEITGTTGIIWVNGFWGSVADRPPLIMRRYERMVTYGGNIVTDPKAAYKRAAAIFVQSLQAGKTLTPGIDEAIADLKLLVAAAKSAADGGRVRVE